MHIQDGSILLNDESNKDEISKFLAMTLRYLNAYIGYYLAIRSGNFVLRNACLSVLTELFFSYSHDRYEELACQTINDVIKYHIHIYEAFVNGEWVICKEGKKFHSVALDKQCLFLEDQTIKGKLTVAYGFMPTVLSVNRFSLLQMIQMYGCMDWPF